MDSSGKADGKNLHFKLRSSTMSTREGFSTTDQNKELHPAEPMNLTMQDFLGSAELSNYTGVFEGVTLDGILKMSQQELFKEYNRTMPPEELHKFTAAVCEWRKVTGIEENIGNTNLWDDLPDLPTYLTNRGFPDYFLGYLKGIDMKRFLKLSEAEVERICYSEQDLLKACQHELLQYLEKEKLHRKEPSSTTTPATYSHFAEQEEALQSFLDSIKMNKYFPVLTERNMSRDSLLISSKAQLTDLGIHESDAQDLHTAIQKHRSFGIQTTTSDNFPNQNKETTSKKSVDASANPEICSISYADRVKGCSQISSIGNGGGQDRNYPRVKTRSYPVSSYQSSSTPVLPVGAALAQPEHRAEISANPPAPIGLSVSSPIRTELPLSHQGTPMTVTSNPSGITAESFLVRHGFSVPQGQKFEDFSDLSYALNSLSDSERWKLLLLSLESNRALLSENATLKQQLAEQLDTLGRINYGPVDEDTEMTDVNDSSHPLYEYCNSPQPSGINQSISADFSGSEMASLTVALGHQFTFVPRTAINLLLLGESGVGKSTFINAFANYVNYERLTEARDNMIALIPSSFFLSDDNFIDHKVSIGSQFEKSHLNECLTQRGQSSTQSCRSYVFPSKNGAVRIIDTPGVGDTRGLEQDSLNFDNILSYISQFDELHAICILLKPNNAKLTAGFRLCINQLLNNLEKSAAQNIVFLFTNARSTFYQPGDTKPVLENILREVAEQPPYVKIKFDQTTSYCVDNESFRFLAAISNGLHFLEPDLGSFEESWTTSVTECKRLMEYILTLTPHRVRETISISEARRLIDELAGPVADILLDISVNMLRFKKHADTWKQNRNANEGIESLKSKLKSTIVKTCYRYFPNPKTVCASEKCIVFHINGDPYFPQVCHDECFLPLKTFERLGDPNLKKCATFIDDICRNCRCGWQYHMRITREKFTRETKVEDAKVKGLLRNATTIEEAVQALEQSDELYKKERKLLVDTMAFFAVFQNINSITGRGDPFRDFLLDGLRLATYKKASAGSMNDDLIKMLDLILRNYDRTKKKLSDTVEDEREDSMKMTPENVFKHQQALYNLEIHGQSLRELRETIEKGRLKNAVSYAEEVVESLRQSGDPGSTSILQPVESYFTRN